MVMLVLCKPFDDYKINHLIVTCYFNTDGRLILVYPVIHSAKYGDAEQKKAAYRGVATHLYSADDNYLSLSAPKIMLQHKRTEKRTLNFS